MTDPSLLVAIVAAPFAALLPCLAFGRALGRGAALFVIAAALLAFAGVLELARAPEPALVSFPWVPSLGLSFRLRADGFGLLFAGLISAIGALVALYSSAYLPELTAARHGRFYAALAGFMGAMLGIALADDLLLLFVFWEITSLTSFLLIGFWYERESARDAALTALLVTALGGLAMLAGFVLVGLATGTYSPSEIAADAAVRARLSLSPWFVPALLLILLGAFTKSAQFPFHFWLPAAMVAPTPVSAYLHAATMVKAGIFLLGRIGPLFAVSELWPALLVPIGLFTFLLGAWQSFREHDLKALLAYSTVSTLGLVTFLYGLRAPEQDALQMLSHAAYKGTLFLVAGIVEHATGTRDLRELGGLRRRLPISFALCALGALSMAGLPPLFGFVAKETLYAGLLDSPLLAATPALHAGVAALVVVGNALILGAALRMLLGVFFGAERELRPGAHGLHEPVALWLPPAVLATGVVAFALLLLGPIGSDLLGGMSSTPSTALDVGLVPHRLGPFGLSLATIALGLGLYAARERVHTLQRAADGLPSAQAVWDAGVAGITWFAESYSERWQNGSLRWYFSATLLFTAGLSLLVLQFGGLTPRDVAIDLGNLTWPGLVLAALLVFATLGVVRADTRLGAALALTSSGFLVALLYAVYRSPDILLTQILIETVSTIVLLLVLYFMPPFRADGLSPGQKAWSALVAGSFGVAMFMLVLLATGAGLRETQTIAADYLARSLSEAGGRNAVNVIIVDFRALDTLGEITVLVVVALCAYGLMRARREA